MQPIFIERKLQRRLAQLYDLRIVQRQAIRGWKILKDRKYHPFPPETIDWDGFDIGDHWGKLWESYWFQSDLRIPMDYPFSEDARFRPVLYLNLGTPQEFEAGPEGLLFLNKKPVGGLDSNHREIWVTDEEWRLGKHEVLIKAFTGTNVGERTFQQAELVFVDIRVDSLYYALYQAYDIALQLDENDIVRTQLLQAVDSAVLKIDTRAPHSSEFAKSITEALATFQSNVESLKGHGNFPKIHLVGHAHIDVAWLWRLEQTREKAARTFSSVLRLMDEDPNFKYVQSQPQLYEFIKTDYPDLYQKIKEKVTGGQWEPTGAMWVEADCNIPSGESLVRQIMYGTQFFMQEFGISNYTLWLPDVFGYNWQMPQILQRSGINSFMTTKISWNQFNRPVHDTFWWRGLDGTELLTHFVTTPTPDAPQVNFFTYNGVVTAESVYGTWRNYQQQDVNQNLLLAFGYGDGGGGPTREMLKAANNWLEVPGGTSVVHSKVEDYFGLLHSNFDGSSELPVWDGELYLEYHRGTYTSQAKNKKFNRQSESLYRDAEFLSVVATNLTGAMYPKQDLDRGWKLILLNQFHDIIPGSSIAEVYIDSLRDYEQVQDIGAKVLDRAAKALFPEEHRGIIVTNSLSWEVSGLVYTPWREEFQEYEVIDDVTGAIIPVDRMEPLDVIVPGTALPAEVAILHVDKVPAMGWKHLSLKSKSAPLPLPNSCRVEHAGNEVTIDNGCLQVVFDKNGMISNLFDKAADRNILPRDSAANRLIAFEDKPLDYDAWDIDVFYTEKSWPVADLTKREVTLLSDGGVNIVQSWKFMNSVISQRAVVRPNNREIRFETEVDWHEHQVLLRVEFPTDVRTTKATCDIQFGNMERPTHANTSWDVAKFEVCAHKWVDVSERNYGVSLYNNCKYGHDVRNGNLSLTLIKSAIWPDRNADNGVHRFTYSIYPHQGDWYAADTARRAYELNSPLRAFTGAPTRAIAPSFSFCSVDSSNVMIEAVKLCERGTGTIVRLYEFAGARTSCALCFSQPVTQAFLCNLMEAEEAELALGTPQKTVTVSVKPYQIVTLKVVFAVENRA